MGKRWERERSREEKRERGREEEYERGSKGNVDNHFKLNPPHPEHESLPLFKTYISNTHR